MYMVLLLSRLERKTEVRKLVIESFKCFTS